MSAVSDIKLDWIDGIDGKAVPDKALPPPASHETIKSANIGSWRAHLDALQAYVFLCSAWHFGRLEINTSTMYPV